MTLYEFINLCKNIDNVYDDKELCNEFFRKNVELINNCCIYSSNFDEQIYIELEDIILHGEIEPLKRLIGIYESISHYDRVENIYDTIENIMVSLDIDKQRNFLNDLESFLSNYSSK